jgi:NADPH:quinone reductase
MATMKSVVYDRFGPPAEVLAVRDVPVPEPGPGQVRVRLLQSPIHNHDLATIRGVYGIKPPLPAIPGTEAVGVVDAVGPDVGGAVAVGGRVSAGGVVGAWAELFLARAATLVPVPAALSDDVACQLLAMPLSVCMLLDDLAARPGDWIIQNAANGAVGRLLDVMAADRGLQVINVVRRKQAAAALEAEGVRRVVSTDDAGWLAQAASLTGGAPIAHALDSVGGRAAGDLTRALGPGGVLWCFGALSGDPLAIDVREVLFKEVVVRGFWAVRRARRTPPEDTRRMVGDVLRLAAAGRLPLRVAGSFPLEQAAAATAASEQPARLGKITLRAR